MFCLCETCGLEEENKRSGFTDLLLYTLSSIILILNSHIWLFSNSMLVFVLSLLSIHMKQRAQAHQPKTERKVFHLLSCGACFKWCVYLSCISEELVVEVQVVKEYTPALGTWESLTLSPPKYDENIPKSAVITVDIFYFLLFCFVFI